MRLRAIYQNCDVARRRLPAQVRRPLAPDSRIRAPQEIAASREVRAGDSGRNLLRLEGLGRGRNGPVLDGPVLAVRLLSGAWPDPQGPENKKDTSINR